MTETAEATRSTRLRDALDVAGSRVAKLIVGFALTYAAVRWKVSLPPQYEWMRETFEQIIASAFAASALGLIAHFGIAIKRNPRDTVSPTEMKAGREAKKERAVVRKTEERLQKAGLGAADEEQRLFRPPHNQD